MLHQGLPSLRKPSVPEMGPGAMALTLTPLGPHSTARCLVIASADRKITEISMWLFYNDHGNGAFTICSLGRASVHLEALSSVPKCCRDVDYAATVILVKNRLKQISFLSAKSR